MDMYKGFSLCALKCWLQLKCEVGKDRRKDTVLLCTAQLENPIMLITNLCGKQGAWITYADLILDLLSWWYQPQLQVHSLLILRY